MPRPVFWQRVIDGNPPDVVTYADAVQRYGLSTATGAVVAYEDTVKEVLALKALQIKAKEMEAIQEEIKGRLIACMGDKGDAIVDAEANFLVTYKLAKGITRLDGKALERDLPDVYKKYLKTGEPSRRFLIK